MHLNTRTIALLACSACLSILLPNALRADTITVYENTTGATPLISRTATFSSLSTFNNISNYTEDGLSFSIPGAGDDEFLTPAPGGFSGGFLYPNGGSPNPLTISTTDNATLYGIQFNLGSGDSLEFYAGDTLPIAYELLSGATVVGSGSLDAVQTSSGYLLGFSDPSGFTSLVITNCLSDPCSISDENVIAIDNVAADLTAPVSLVTSTPEPPAATLVATGMLAFAGLARRKLRRTAGCEAATSTRLQSA
jgi:hypothetical protein